MSHVNDLNGRRFGSLEVLERAESNKRGRAQWRCRCDCGRESVALGNNLLAGISGSCGCRINRGQSTHNGHGTRLYRCWDNMKSRCLHRSYPSYHRYGGRGITFAPEWIEFKRFREWALTNGYRDDLTLDRVDNDGDYGPSNCRWATMAEQAKNRAPRGLA